MSRGNKAVRGRDDFARNTHSLKRCNKWECSVRKQADVFYAEVFGEGCLKFLVIMTVVGKPFAVPNILEKWGELFQ